MTNEQYLNRLKEMYSELLVRWSMMIKFGGEWNAGYSEGLSYAREVLYPVIRDLENEARKGDKHNARELDKYSNGPKSSNCGNNCKCC